MVVREINLLSEVIRVRFLMLSVLIGVSSVALGVYEGVFNIFNSLLAIFTVFLMHVAVNSINSASDFRRGIDEETEKTPFSGGITTIVEGDFSYRKAVYVGLVSLLLTFPAYIYFSSIYSNVLMTIFFLSGAIVAAGYTDFFARVYLGEIAAGIGLGTLPILFIFYVQSGTITFNSILISALMFIPTFNLLLINEFPDLRVDRSKGRRNILILIGKKSSIYLFTMFNAIFLISVVFLILSNKFPVYLASLAIPAMIDMHNEKQMFNQDFNLEIHNLKLNVISVHLKFFLLGVSLILPTVI